MRIGMLRAKYLDMANMNFATGQYLEAEGDIKAFLDTIKDGTKAAMDIKIEFDKIEQRKHMQRKQLDEHIQGKGELERTDLKNQGRLEIEVDALHDKKVICWYLAQVHGLFDE